mmetsp:Transcript_2352/g.3304  ORF Transcript_2352/g.3304 Transcript_2352/m.3304 type:complete len:576 (+) Transcript_2352:40-1767(+)
MARGSLKNLKRSRASGGDKYNKGNQNSGLQPAHGLDPGGSSMLQGSDLDGADLVGWLNCECFFSLVLVGLLAALPFNLHTNDLLQTRESYISRAAELFSEGAFEKAASLYERAVNAEETADGHVYLAETLVRVDRTEEAIRHYSRATEMYSDDQEKVASLVNIGKLQAELGRPEMAVQSYQMVLDLQPGVETPEIADAHLQVAVSLLESQRYEEAVTHLETATSIVPTLAPAHLLLANAYRDMGLPEKAIARYKKVIKYRPRDTAGLSALGFAYHELGNFKQALQMYRKALSIAPTAPDVQYMVAALQGHQVHPARAPSQYVSALFDLEARRSARVAALQHSTNQANSKSAAQAERLQGDFREVNGLIFQNLPKVMRGLVEEVLGLRAGDHWVDVLDLGCGKGAAGREFYPLSNRITGVDVSKLALDQARQGGSYDEFKHGDFILSLKNMLPQSMDLIIASDSLPYIGELKELFQFLVQVLRQDGVFVFNVDVLESSEEITHDQSRSFELSFMGRWAHSPSYIQTLATEMGLVLKRASTVMAETHFKSNGSSLIERLDTSYKIKTNVFVFQLKDF